MRSFPSVEALEWRSFRLRLSPSVVGASGTFDLRSIGSRYLLMSSYHTYEPNDTR